MMAEIRLSSTSSATPMGTVIWTKVSGMISRVMVASGVPTADATGATGVTVALTGVGILADGLAAVGISATHEIDVI